jgi:hypothetical protein
MHAWLALFLFLPQPFWEAKPPEKWTDHEIDLMRISSPWTQTLGPAPELLTWFATAQPMEEAEAEAGLHIRNPLREPGPDYLSFLSENREKVFVLAIGYPNLTGLSKEADAWRTVQKETVMQLGPKSI